MVLRALFILLVFHYGTTMHAQQGQWQIKAGASYAHCSDPLGEGHGGHTGRRATGMGGHVGAALEMVLKARFGLRAEILIEARQVGYEMVQGRIPMSWPSGGEHVATGDRMTRMVHLHLPVIFAVREWSLLRIDAGINTGYLLGAQDRIRRIDPSGKMRDHTVAHHNNTGSLARWECALLVGAEVDSGRRLGMGLRYLHGLTDLDNGPGASPSLPRTWQIALTYRLGRQEGSQNTFRRT